MRAWLSPKRLASRLRGDLGPLGLLSCSAVLVAADLAYQRAGDSVFPGGPLDETAHFLTALLLIQLLPTVVRARVAIPALVASVAIDLDHVPQYLGDYFLTIGTPRPYTHSLLTPLVLLVLALALRRHRVLLLGLALGVLLHFFRDLAEGNGSGVSLLWPLSDHAFSYPHATYLLLMGCVVAAELCLTLLRPRSATMAPRRARRRSA
jgi:inner membrane protein